MKIAAVIAEYNPFHNGHAYQLRLIKERYGYDFIIVVMSGDFTQRGEPAIVDKYTRTQMALSGGADLVLELPAYYACASAEYFATGAVSLLHGLSCVDALFFGSESEDTDTSCPNPPALLSRAASILLKEPPEYRRVLSDSLRQGHHYAAARMEALTAMLKSDHTLQTAPAGAYTEQNTLPVKEVFDSGNLPAPNILLPLDTAEGHFHNLSSTLSLPNNTLGIEYCKAILRLKSPIKPYAIKRVGSNYHDTDINGCYAGAEAVRALLLRQPCPDAPAQDLSVFSAKSTVLSTGVDSIATVSEITDSILSRLYALVPADAAQTLFGQYQAHALIHPDDFSSLMHYRLLLEASRLEQYADCPPELANRIRTLMPSLLDLPVTGMISALKTKAFTHTRISRVLTHLLLNMTVENLTLFTDRHDPAYLMHARILGFRKDACGTLLSAVKENTRIPLITKPSDYHPAGAAAALYEADLFASHIYQDIAAKKSCSPFRHELTRTPLILP